ncbi:hypothetical protein L873DRAFT_1277484 [Choiromyces venosus 120613-1]|uniref:Uncharacterized protein n=1 Tax=Choiromyces venosus 120613-1 TaxID=1336337 RepID=A0A3N4K251_9PEZI|nr:hypothetical protein L873DRAFT_1277484 [Choiromyces venosus 120613-1]
MTRSWHFSSGVYMTKENDPSFSSTQQPQHRPTTIYQAPPFTEQQQTANLQQPNAQNMSGAVHNVADSCHNLSTEAAQIQMLQQLLNVQQELRERVRQLLSQPQRLLMMLYNAQNML